MFTHCNACHKVMRNWVLFYVLSFSWWQGIYYYFYQVFKNKAEAIAAARKLKGRGDGTIGMFSWLSVAALAGYS